jgi:hypothetical protein
LQDSPQVGCETEDGNTQNNTQPAARQPGLSGAAQSLPSAGAAAASVTGRYIYLILHILLYM